MIYSTACLQLLGRLSSAETRRPLVPNKNGLLTKRPFNPILPTFVSNHSKNLAHLHTSLMRLPKQDAIIPGRPHPNSAFQSLFFLRHWDIRSDRKLAVLRVWAFFRLDIDRERFRPVVRSRHSYPVVLLLHKDSVHHSRGMYYQNSTSARSQGLCCRLWLLFAFYHLVGRSPQYHKVDFSCRWSGQGVHDLSGRLHPLQFSSPCLLEQ